MLLLEAYNLDFRGYYMNCHLDSNNLDISSQSHHLKVNSKWMEEKIMELASYTNSNLDGYTRLAFSKEDKIVRELVIRIMKNIGLEVRIDPAGNIIGRRNGKQSQAPVIMTGSHIDTVKHGGRFDGVAGVISAIEAVRCLHSSNLITQHPIEVVVFTSEEPNEFGISTVGSRAIAGTFDKELLVTLTNNDGLTLGSAIASIGGNPKNFAKAARRRGSILAFLELHIEQGPILENMSVPIGVVTKIAGILRERVIVLGSSDHAGTTPMNMRKDALVAAAEAIRALEKLSHRKYANDTVATIGLIDNFPNAANVISGKVVMCTDIRSTSQLLMERTEEHFRRELCKIAARRSVNIYLDRLSFSKPQIMNQWVKSKIEESCQKLGVPYHRMISGAGHDASHLTEIARVGMIFVPSKAGKSHCPEEWTDFKNIALGTKVLAHTIITIDKKAKEITSNGR